MGGTSDPSETTPSGGNHHAPCYVRRIASRVFCDKYDACSNGYVRHMFTLCEERLSITHNSPAHTSPTYSSPVRTRMSASHCLLGVVNAQLAGRVLEISSVALRRNSSFVWLLHKVVPALLFAKVNCILSCVEFHHKRLLMIRTVDRSLIHPAVPHTYVLAQPISGLSHRPDPWRISKSRRQSRVPALPDCVAGFDGW